MKNVIVGQSGGPTAVINSSLLGVFKTAKDRGADIVMYGHTHRPAYSDEDGLITLNPGSISYPRQAGREPSYMIMEIDENGAVNVQLMHV